MKINVLLFGIVKEIAGTSSLVMELEEPNVNSLVNQLQEKHEKLRHLKSMLVAVNNEYAPMDKTLTEEDEVAIIPPVAGG